MKNRFTNFYILYTVCVLLLQAFPGTTAIKAVSVVSTLIRPTDPDRDDARVEQSDLDLRSLSVHYVHRLVGP